MKTEEIKRFVDRMTNGDISIFLKLYTQECYKEMVEMGFIDQTYEEYVEEWKGNIDDLLQDEGGLKELAYNKSMKLFEVKKYQEACDAGIILKGMSVLVDGIEILVERGSEIQGFFGTDKDGEEYAFTHEQVTAIIGW